MKKILIGLLLFFTFDAFAQITKEEFEQKTNELNNKITDLQTKNGDRKNEIGSLNSKFDSLQRKFETDSVVNTQAREKLEAKMNEIGKSSADKISVVAESLSKNSLYGIIAVLLITTLAGLLYWLLSKRQKLDKTDIESQLTKTKKSIEEEQILVNTKLAELYNGQIELLNAERKAKGNSQNIDHSLPLKVADYISKMQMNLALMDSKVRGHLQLTYAINAVLDNFKANQYTIIGAELLGKSYSPGDTVIPTMRPNSNLKKDEMIITQIIKPQVNFSGELIQAAEVIVDYGE